MKVVVNCSGHKFEVACGPGKQHIRWLGLVVATRMQREKYPHAFRVPQRVLSSEGMLRPRSIINEVLEDGEEITVELRQGATVPEEWYEDEKEWIDEAYGTSSGLMECRFRWKVDHKAGFDKPQLVRGVYQVAPKWVAVFPQEQYGGKFEIPVDPVGDGDQLDWVATRKGPPGTCTFKFVFKKKEEEGGGEMEAVCKASPETLSKDGQSHSVEFPWDVPIAPEPFPEVDSRPSTASSRDGAKADPRFEMDWEAMRLRWVEPFMKVRVKDVLTEFYAILIDLFDSYAFMGLDLASSQHTIGMDDWKHLMLQCNLLEGQSEGGLSWSVVCGWYEEAANVKDARPYLAQRLPQAVYLELLLRTAGWAMCQDQKKGTAMPIDEGLFRFITDILIPVMDVYDDDPIRKDAVQHQNLIVIQQNRPSIRSIYSFLAQSWPFCDDEQLVSPAVLKFVLEYARERLQEAESSGGAAAAGADDKDEKKEEKKEDKVSSAAVLQGDDKLDIAQLEAIMERIEEIVEEVTNKQVLPFEQRALLFWEFFEVSMQCCRLLVPVGVPLHEGIPAYVQTCLAVMSLVEVGEVQLPPPPEVVMDMEETQKVEG